VPVTLWPGTQWNGKYVVLFEPPEERGRATSLPPAVGPRIIRDLDRLRRLASTQVERLQLAEHPGMRLLAELSPLDPMLTRIGSSRGKPYYLVPFGVGRSEIQAAMILNAYTGVFEEAIVLSEDCFFKYLTRMEALELASTRLRAPTEWLIQPTLVFKQTIETPNRFFPVWYVGLRHDVFITPRAEVLHELAATEEAFWSRLQ
jgi:hypothetical protein